MYITILPVSNETMSHTVYLGDQTPPLLVARKKACTLIVAKLLAFNEPAGYCAVLLPANTTKQVKRVRKAIAESDIAASLPIIEAKSWATTDFHYMAPSLTIDKLGIKLVFERRGGAFGTPGNPQLITSVNIELV